MFAELMPIIKQCESLKLSLSHRENGDLSVVMQSTLKPLPENATDAAKQLYAALSMPLVVTAPFEELDENFVSLIAEYCQQHAQTQTALDASLDRIKEGNKSARQTASPYTKKADTSKSVKKAEMKDEVAPPAQSVTQQSNPASLF